MAGSVVTLRSAWLMIPVGLVLWAEPAFAQEVDPTPTDVSETVVEARRLVESGRTAEAIGLLDRLLEAEPTDAEALSFRAQIAEWNQDFQTAESLLRSAVALRPDDEALRADFEEASRNARTLREAPKYVSLSLLFGWFAFCIVMGSTVRRMTHRVHLLLGLVTALLVGLTWLRLHLGS